MSSEKTKSVKKQDIKWAAVLWYIHLHVLGLYAIWLMVTSAKWMTIFFTLFVTSIGCLGVTMNHRLWAHRSFKAASSLKIFLVLAHTLAGVGTIYDSVLYHRLHHMYYGTDKDPYNHKKGFLYSHYLGNFLSPNVSYEQAKIDIDMRDMENDTYVMFQKRFYWLLFGIFGLLLPLNAPLEYWDESMPLTILITGILRFAITVNVNWLVNSALVIWNAEGTKLMSIFDTISLLYRLFFNMPKSHGTVVVGSDGVVASRSISIFFIKKSYWPTYHYTVPWDWKCSEFGKYDAGCSTFFIKMWNELGLVQEMQTATNEDVRDMLHRVAMKKITMDEGLEQLKNSADYNAKKQKLDSRG